MKQNWILYLILILLAAILYFAFRINKGQQVILSGRDQVVADSMNAVLASRDSLIASLDERYKKDSLHFVSKIDSLNELRVKEQQWRRRASKKKNDEIKAVADEETGTSIEIIKGKL